MGMRVLHVVPTFFPAAYYGGPIFSVHSLCGRLAAHDEIRRLLVLTTDSSGPFLSDRLKGFGMPHTFESGYQVYYCLKTGPGLFAPSLLLRLLKMVPVADVVHLTGVYSFTTLPVLLLCRLFRKPLVWSPRGALQRWDGSTRPVLKREWERLCSLIVRKPFVLHVTSEPEAEESRGRIRGARVTIVPNGVEIPVAVPNRSWKPDRRLRLLFVGRLHPKKGIENLLQALAIMSDTVHLNICGAGDPTYTQALRVQAETLGIGQRVTFSGHVEDSAKAAAFRQADICVVPSHTENFGMVVAEALAHGVPVIASKGTPWPGLEDNRCGSWVDNSPDSLASAIADMSQRDLAEMGANGRRWMESEFSWDRIARRMLDLYREASGVARKMNS